MLDSEIYRFIQKNRNRHLSNKVLHAHPSPAHWKSNFRNDEVSRLLLSDDGSKTNVNMYLGIPYCLQTDPPHCGFCLFPTEKYNGSKSISEYLSYLEKEASLYEDFYSNSLIKTLYVGGGTPNLLLEQDYFRLMNIIHRLFPAMDSDIEKTLEGIPQLFNQNKIQAISEAGFNRVSMGVQQVSDRLIQYSGRKQTRKQVFDAIDNFKKYGLSFSIDLIYGWPEQTIDDMLNDLKEIVETGVSHITHYELNIAGRSNFSTKMKNLIPGISDKILMYQASKEFLESHGYQQKTVYDWEKLKTDTLSNPNAKDYLYEENLRDFLYEDNQEETQCMGGLGYAAVNIRTRHLNSDLASVSTMNTRNIQQYQNSILSGQLPLERAYTHSAEDVRLIWLFQSLQTMKINIEKYGKIFDRSLIGDYKNIWKILQDEGWLAIENNHIELKAEGEFYVPLIQSLLSYDRVKEVTSITKNQNDRSG